MSDVFLLTIDGIKVEVPVGVFSTIETAHAYAKRLDIISDGWHRLHIRRITVDEQPPISDWQWLLNPRNGSHANKQRIILPDITNP